VKRAQIRNIRRINGYYASRQIHILFELLRVNSTRNVYRPLLQRVLVSDRHTD